jgi:hypothetical protein
VNFSNGSGIQGQATSEDAGRSGAFNCVDGDSYVTIRDIITGEVKRVTMRELEQLLMIESDKHVHKYDCIVRLDDN